ncbi:TPA: OmpA family protein [Vibrio vulnificus]|nr:OmpA family protein [Vibrio vulnificus]
MKTLDRYCSLALLILTSVSLEAKPSIPNAVVGIGSFYQQGEWGEQFSLGVQFDAAMSSWVEYQHQEESERVMLSIDRNFPVSKSVTLVIKAGSTIWLEDKQDRDAIFDPLMGIGIRYDWSPYVAASFSYQNVFNNGSRALLEPSMSLGLVFRPFYQPVVPREWNQIESKSLQRPVASTARCDVGRFLSSFYFAHDQAMTEIQHEHVKQLQLYNADNLTVIGHTDASGEYEYNQRLGLRRAQFVEQALVKYGVKENSITVCSQGEKGATSQNETIEDWMFRRVDVYLNEPSLE